jgi:YD repeat-containing protein
MVNAYAGGRVVRQDHGGGFFQLTPVSPAEIDVLDRAGTTTRFTFPASPYWDAAVPRTIVDPAGETTALTHDHHGQLIELRAPAGGRTVYVYDGESPYPRSRGNLLAVKRIPESGRSEVWTYRYDLTYNVVVRSVPPEGNHDFADPRMYESYFNHDFQRNVGTAGDVVDSGAPRRLTMYSYPIASDQRRPTWIEVTPRREFARNGFGLVTRAVDERGIATRYLYYPVTDPTGAGGAAPAEAGGGFLGRLVIDAETTPRRDLYLPGVPTAALAIDFGYDPLGYVNRKTGPDGSVASLDRNALGDLVQATRAAGDPGAELRGETHVGPHGRPARLTQHQPGAPDAAGGAALVRTYAYDRTGNLQRQSTAVTPASTHQEQLGWDERDELRTYRPPAVLSGDTPQAFSSAGYDERGLPSGWTLRAGAATPDVVRTELATGGLIDALTGRGSRTGFQRDGFGRVTQAVDGAGEERHYLFNEDGKLVVELGRPAGPATPGRAATSWFTETVYRMESGLPVRVHRGRFDPNRLPAGAAPTALAPVPEYLGELPAVRYLPEAARATPDGPLAPLDGRSTTDFVYDVSGRIVRVVEDDLAVTYYRYDALGRVIETEDANRNRTSISHDDARRETVAATRAVEDEPVNPTERTYRMRTRTDAAGRVVLAVDHQGRAHHVRHSASGHTTSLFDPLGPPSSETVDGTPATPFVNAPGNEVIFRRDADGRVIEAEAVLTEGGQGGRPVDTSNPYNPAGKVLRKASFDPDGRLRALENGTGRTTTLKRRPDGLVETVQMPDAETYALTYDAVGRIDTRTDANGTKLKYHYAADRLERITVEEAPAGIRKVGYSFRYDGSGNLVEARELVDPNEVAPPGTPAPLVAGLAWDSRGNLVEEQRDGIAYRYEYTGSGRLAKIVHPDDSVMEFVYGPTGLLRETRRGGVTHTQFWYLGDQRLRKFASAGVTTTIVFDPGGEPSEVQVSGLPGGDVRHVLTLDRLGRIAAEERHHNGLVEKRVYERDSLGRVTRETVTLPATLAAAPQGVEFFYDADHVLRQANHFTVDAQGNRVPTREVHQERDGEGRIIRIDVTPPGGVVTP